MACAIAPGGGRNPAVIRARLAEILGCEVVFIEDWLDPATGAITEAGLLDAGSTGNLLCRQVFSAVNKGASDSLQITWTLNL